MRFQRSIIFPSQMPQSVFNLRHRVASVYILNETVNDLIKFTIAISTANYNYNLQQPLFLRRSAFPAQEGGS